MNINKAIVATAKKQKECLLAFVVIYGLRDYKEFYKDVFVRAAICEVGPNFSYEPLAGISRKEFRRIGIYSPDEFAPKIKSAERITASNLILAKL